MLVYKFGGASVKDADSVKNVSRILKRVVGQQLVLVVSAMGKTTNALEKVMQEFWVGKSAEPFIAEIEKYHLDIIDGLFPANGESIRKELKKITAALREKCSGSHSDNYHFEYDQIISLGEVIATKIIHAYLAASGLKASWIDARKIIRTTDRYREANVEWNKSTALVKRRIEKSTLDGNTVHITQGFIGHTREGFTTTLGREGSDFTAAILGHILDAESVTIWKDVPGMLNADPKYFDNTVLLEKISFKEAIELAYFGASVIHPKTIQPLKQKGIPLFIKSFLDPDAMGSVIQESTAFDNHVPSFIFRMNQLLISLSPRDFSFVVEENLEDIFRYMSAQNVRINLMQNAAVSFSFCVDSDKIDLKKLIEHFKPDYEVRYNQNMELVTIRHYDDPTLERLLFQKKVFLEQKSRDTARLVIQDKTT